MSRNNLQSLGWTFDYTFLGRFIYKIGKRYIFDHLGNIGLMINDRFIYCNLSIEDLKKLTNLVKKEKNIIDHDDKYTLRQYNKIKNLIDEFYNNHGYKVEDIEDEDEDNE